MNPDRRAALAAHITYNLTHDMPISAAAHLSLRAAEIAEERGDPDAPTFASLAASLRGWRADHIDGTPDEIAAAYAAWPPPSDAEVVARCLDGTPHEP